MEKRIARDSRVSREAEVLTFEAFIDKIVSDLADICGPEFEVKRVTAIKNNSVELNGVSLREKGTLVAPTIYLEPLYKRYIDKEVSLTEAENDILRIYKAKGRPDLDVGSLFSDFSKIKDRINVRLINRESNKKLLEDTPYEEYLDLAIIYTIDFSDFNGSITIRNSHIHYWGITVDDVKEAAEHNLKNTDKVIIKRFGEMVNDLTQEECSDIIGGLMYVLTNVNYAYGASGVLRVDKLKNLSKKLGCGFYILPSSVHELIIVPDTDEIDEDCLKEMVVSINRSEVSREDFLSDSIYYYDCDAEKVVVKIR